VSISLANTGATANWLTKGSVIKGKIARVCGDICADIGDRYVDIAKIGLIKIAIIQFNSPHRLGNHAYNMLPCNGCQYALYYNAT
jgi:hypothetical protein